MSLADALLTYLPWPSLPSHLTSYERGRTPLSTPLEVSLALIAYLCTIFGLRAIRHDKPPLALNSLFQAHNIILTLGSGLLLLLMLEEIIPMVWKHGLFYGICAERAWTQRLEFYYMINYYIKYIELLDTVFLALKKKPLAFLHVFHHSATALLCYTQLNGRTSVSWVPIVLNLNVHVFMYYYYYATAGGHRIWWKKYLTTMQITQFVLDLFAVYFASAYLFLHRYSHFTTTYFPFMPNVGDCSGSEGAALFGCALLTSYLGLFIQFYIATYLKKGGKGKANGHVTTNGKTRSDKDL